MQSIHVLFLPGNLPPEYFSIHISFRYGSFETKFHHDCLGEGSWHSQISRTFEDFSDSYLVLVDENKKIHFGVASLIEVSSFPSPVNCIPTKITYSRTVFPLILYYPINNPSLSLCFNVCVQCRHLI